LKPKGVATIRKSCKLLEKLGYKLNKKLQRFEAEQSLYRIKLSKAYE
jgi:hypothetical protein